MTSVVHIGGGRTVTLASSAYEDPTVAVPRKQGREAGTTRDAELARVRARGRHIRPIAGRLLAAPKRYGPTRFIDLDTDQCGWPLPSGYRCGLKVHKHGAAYCEHHDAVSHGRARLHLEAAE